MKTNHVEHGENIEFLGAFGKLRKAAVSFVMSVLLSVRPSTWNNSVLHWMDFHEIWYFINFR